MIDPSLLPTFLCVYEVGAISAAARELHVSQPTVTARVLRLEEELGAPLFKRTVRGVVPTAAAIELAVHARELEQLLSRASAIGTRDELAPLSVAASTTIASHVLPTLLAQFRERHPDVAISVHVGNTREVVERVRGGEVPLGLVEGHARAAGVRLTPYLDDAVVPVVAMSGSAHRTLDQLREATILWREAGSGTRAVVERALRKAKVRRRPLERDIVLGSTGAIAAAAAAGLGVAFLSRWSITRSDLKPLPGLGLQIERTFRWALPAGGLGGTAARFHEFAERNAPRTL